MFTIGIIGGGVGGVSLCLQLKEALSSAASHQKANIQIILFEKNKLIGRGAPYNQPDDCYRINLPKEVMEPLPKEQGKFAIWMNSFPDFRDTDFPPRHFFGRYLEHRAFASKQEAQNLGLKMTFLTEHEVIDIMPLGHDRFEVHSWHDNQLHKHEMNKVILSLGHILTSDFGDLIENTRYIHHPWDSDIDYGIPTHENIGIIGSKLTAVDIALKLHDIEHQGKIYMFSRSGLLPAVKGLASSYQMNHLVAEYIQELLENHPRQPLRLHQLITLLEKELSQVFDYRFNACEFIHQDHHSSALDRINQELNMVEQGQTDWQKVLAVGYQYLARLWPLLTYEDQTLFQTQFKSVFMTYLCSIPKESAYILQKMLQSTQLEVFGGFKQIEYKNSHFVLTLNSGQHVLVDRMMNATGAGNTLPDTPLLKNLLHRGLIMEHPCAGIRVSPTSFQTTNKNGKSNLHLYAIGDLVKGDCFVIIEARRIVEQARMIVSQILINAFP